MRHYAVLVLTLAACGGGGADPVLPEAMSPTPLPTLEDPYCVPTDDPTRSPTHAMDDSPVSIPPGDYHLGYSLGHASFGIHADGSPAHAMHMDLISGAPDVAIGPGRSGLVRLVNMDQSSGQFSSGSGWFDTELAAPPGSEGFGAAVLGYHFSPARSEPDEWVWVGDEILVGAPATEGSTGRVHVYATHIPKASLTASGDRSVWSWELEATLTSPVPGAGRFGAALAAQDVFQFPRWVAVGAPGIDTVFIYEEWYPFNLVQTIKLSDLTGAPPSAGFGATLLVEDVDVDGYADLIVGAPEGAAGRVFVIRGDAGGLLDPTLWSVVDLGGAHGTFDRFGEAFDAGPLYEDTEMDGPMGLAIGAPGADVDGLLCAIGVQSARSSSEPPAFQLHDGATSTPQCMAFPFTSAGPAEFGASVAVADFSPYTTFFATYNGASVPEIAVGAPGADDVEWVWDDALGLYEAIDGPEASSGLVVFLRSDESGPVFFDGPLVEPGERPLAERIHRPVAGASRFGQSMLALYAQRGPVEDLLVGAPHHDAGGGRQDGAFQLLNSHGENGVEDNPGGTFSGTDSAGTEIEMKVVQAGPRLLAHAGRIFTLDMKRIVDGEARYCKIPDVFGEDFEISLDVWLEFALAHELGGASTTEWLIVDGAGNPKTPEEFASMERKFGYRIEITMESAGFSNFDPFDDTYTLTIGRVERWTGSKWSDAYTVLIHPECGIVGNPFTFTRTRELGASCD